MYYNFISKNIGSIGASAQYMEFSINIINGFINLAQKFQKN